MTNQSTLLNRREFGSLVGGIGLSSLFGSIPKVHAEPALDGASADVTDAEMKSVYEEVKTPYKYGVVLPQEEGDLVDSPGIFRVGNFWYMVYLRMFGGIGYGARLARSENLLDWEPLGTTMSFRKTGWDAWQSSPTAILIDPIWGGGAAMEPFEGKYWFTYIGGAGKGYEPDPLKIGLAWTDDPTSPKPYHRLPDPILTPQDADVREFEKVTLYKTNVFRDKEKRLGASFICYYNGKNIENGQSVERIGMAVSDDLRQWRRYGNGPVIDNGSGISGDPQVVKVGDLWVMFYFGAFWKPKAFDTFAVSKDAVHWRKWEGPHLIEPSEPYDAQFAHKPWVIKYDGVVYHFYCAVGDQGRCIALATSKKI